jgi:hypothetical protein
MRAGIRQQHPLMWPGPRQDIGELPDVGHKGQEVTRGLCPPQVSKCASVL